jgi:uncharacterized YccA/Bax inhibitor family protein
MSTQMLNEQTFTPAHMKGITVERARTMTVGGTAVKAAFLVLVTLIFAGIGWDSAADVLVKSGLWFFLGFLLLLGLSLAAAANPRIAPIAGLVYAILMGLWMGAISRVYESYYDGIVAQALFATVAVFVACLILYLVGFVKVSGRFVRVVVAATFGIALLYLFGWLFSLFGIDLLFFTDPGNTTGIIISVVICLVAALNLFIDFAVIDGGVKAGAPKAMEWYCAFALLSTLVWLYIEVLRLLARLGSR